MQFLLDLMFGQINGLINNPGIKTFLMIALVLTAGSMFLTWLGDMITVKGIGNGVSVLIFAGIVARMPHDIYDSL